MLSSDLVRRVLDAAPDALIIFDGVGRAIQNALREARRTADRANLRTASKPINPDQLLALIRELGMANGTAG